MSDLRKKAKRAQLRLWVNRWFSQFSWALVGAAVLFVLAVLADRLYLVRPEPEVLLGWITLGLAGASFLGYGVTLAVGIGIPIPVLNVEVLRSAAVPDEELFAPIVDYSSDYPELTGKTLGRVSYAELRSGSINIDGKQVRTGSLSSYPRAVEIAETLKSWIQKGDFTISEPVKLLPCPDRDALEGDE